MNIIDILIINLVREMGAEAWAIAITGFVVTMALGLIGYLGNRALHQIDNSVCALNKKIDDMPIIYVPRAEIKLMFDNLNDRRMEDSKKIDGLGSKMDSLIKTQRSTQPK